MRTKILKFGMPLMAFLLAIVFAFATEKSLPEEENALITGYIGTPANCHSQEVKNCTMEFGPVCKYLGQTVYSDLGCNSFLFERVQ